jgi:hypothetical protein
MGRRWSIVLGCISNDQNTSECNILLLAKNRGESADLSTESRPNVLGSVRNQVLYSGHDIIEQCGSINQLAET